MGKMPSNASSAKLILILTKIVLSYSYVVHIISVDPSCLTMTMNTSTSFSGIATKSNNWAAGEAAGEGWPGLVWRRKAGGGVASAGVFVSLSEYSGAMAAICFVHRPLNNINLARVVVVVLPLP